LIAEEGEALRLNANNALAHFCLGDALEHKHDIKAALEQYRVAYELNPADANYRKKYERLIKEARQ